MGGQKTGQTSNWCTELVFNCTQNTREIKDQTSDLPDRMSQTPYVEVLTYKCSCRCKQCKQFRSTSPVVNRSRSSSNKHSYRGPQVRHCKKCNQAYRLRTNDSGINLMRNETPDNISVQQIFQKSDEKHCTSLNHSRAILNAKNENYLSPARSLYFEQDIYLNQNHQRTTKIEHQLSPMQKIRQKNREKNNALSDVVLNPGIQPYDVQSRQTYEMSYFGPMMQSQQERQRLDNLNLASRVSQKASSPQVIPIAQAIKPYQSKPAVFEQYQTAKKGASEVGSEINLIQESFMFSEQFQNSQDQSREALPDKIILPLDPILNKKTSAQEFLQKFIKESQKVVRSMNGRNIEDLDDIIYTVKNKKQVMKQQRKRATFQQNNSIKSFKSFRSSKSVHSKKSNSPRKGYKPYSKLNYLDVLPEEQTSQHIPTPKGKRDDPIIGSFFTSTAEQQQSDKVNLIQIPQTNFSKRPANNVDMLMSFYENEPSRRNESTLIRVDDNEVCFSERCPVSTMGGKYEEKWVQVNSSGKVVVYSQDPARIQEQDISEENMDQIQCLGDINQVNRSSKCKVEIILDLKYLFAGTVISESNNVVTIEIYKIKKDEERETVVGFIQKWNEKVFYLSIKGKVFNKIKSLRQKIEHQYRSTCSKNGFQQVIYGALLSKQTKFMNFCSISEKKFLEQVDSGDILLFRSNNQIGTWITRTFTKSHFDHVALLLRFGNQVEDLYLLEAVGDSGVRMVSWQSARFYLGSFFDQIAYRKLNFEMNQQRLSNLDKFRRNSCGKSYGLNIGKFFTTKSEAMSQNQQANIHENRQFFCSELVAKAFKVVGVFKDLSKSSTEYYPGSFEPGGLVEQDMIQSASLGPVFNILADSENHLTPMQPLS